MRTFLADDKVVVLVVKHVPCRVSVIVICTAEVLPWLLTGIALERVWRLLEADILLLAVRYLVWRTNWTL